MFRLAPSSRQQLVLRCSAFILMQILLIWLSNGNESTIMIIHSDLYEAATLGTLKSGRLIEVGRLTEVQWGYNIN